MQRKSNLAYFTYEVSVGTTTLIIFTVKYFLSRENMNRFYPLLSDKIVIKIVFM